jgi:hypothetical protein
MMDGITKEGIRNLLRNAVVTVTFTKADGTVRDMKCTLSPDFLPAQEVNESKSFRKISPDSCPVWDMEKQAWRSFRWDSISKISLLDKEVYNG